MTVLVLKIEHPLYRGFFLARHNGKVVMVKGSVMSGETVEAVIDEDKKDYAIASASKILAPSPDRISPPCRYFGDCGGCHTQHIPYKLQIEMKEYVLRDCLQRIMKTDMTLSESMISSNPWNYRLRGQFKISERGIGLYRQGTRDVVEIDECMLMNQIINSHIKKANDVIKDSGITEYHITSGNNLIGMVKARKHVLTDEAAQRLASELMAKGLSGVTIISGDREPVTYGNPFVTLDYSGLQYAISSQSFVQNNWKLNEAVLSLIQEKSGHTMSAQILDLYAGAGNLSLPLARSASVTGVEGNRFAIQDGLRNLKINNISNYRFIESTAERYQSDRKFDAIILDPPRPGLTNRTTKNVLSMRPDQIIYLSCNPTTLARDLKKLSGLYEIESIRLIDFFPQTFHIEALAFLRLR